MEEGFRQELIAVMEGSSIDNHPPSTSQKPNQSLHKSPIAFHQIFIDTHLMKP
jgi:hypothetical protein